MEYMLVICMPRSAGDVLESFRSPTPFLPISVGDLLDPATTPLKKTLRVTGIRHLIGDTASGIVHQVRIFTEEVE